MAKTKIEVDLVIKGGESVEQVEQKTKSLKTQLKEMKALLASGTLDNAQFNKLSKEAGDLQDKIGDVNQQVKNLASDSKSLDGMISITQGIVGGFAAVEGITAMVGEGNEDLQKTMVKLQGAMSALAGIQAVANTLNKTSAAYTTANTIATNVSTFAQKRYAAAVGTTTGAMRLLRIAGAALGIGLIIGAIALLVTNFDKLKNVVGKFIPSLDTITKGFKAAYNAVTDFLGITNDQTRAADKLKISSDKLLKSQQDELEVLKASGATKEELYLAEYNMMVTRIATLDKMAKLNKKYSTEEAAERADLIQSIKVLNAEYRKEESDSDKKKQQEAKEASAKAAAARKVQIEKDAQAQKDLEDKVKKEIAEQDARDKEQELELAEGNNEKYAAVRAVDTENIVKDSQAKLFALGAYNRAVIDAEQSLADAKRNALESGFNIAQQFTGKNKALADTLFAVQKGVAIAQIVIDTQKEIAGYYSNPTWKLLPDGGLSLASAASAGAKIRAAAGIAAIGATTIGKFMGGGGSVGGSSGGGVGMSSQPPRLDTFQSNRPAMNPNQRVYVLEKDITDSQGRVARIRHNATLI